LQRALTRAISHARNITRRISAAMRARESVSGFSAILSRVASQSAAVKSRVRANVEIEKLAHRCNARSRDHENVEIKKLGRTACDPRGDLICPFINQR
jgi:uncharacterized membrane-anchored protein